MGWFIILIYRAHALHEISVAYECCMTYCNTQLMKAAWLIAISYLLSYIQVLELIIYYNDIKFQLTKGAFYGYHP